MAKFLKADLVEKLIAAQGTQFFTIEFAKKDGEIVRKNVRARMQSRRVQEDASAESKERAARQAQTLVTHGMIFLDYPGIGKRGCSVRLDHVVSVSGQGATIAPRG